MLTIGDYYPAMINPLTLLNPRLIAYGALGAAIIGGGMWVRHEWNAGQRAIAEVQRLNRQIAALEAGKRTADAASMRYQDELERLRNRPVRTRVVRLCPDADRNVSPAQPGPTGTGPAGGVGDTGTGPDTRRDIGPDLYALAARCDALTAQLRGLQGFHR